MAGHDTTTPTGMLMLTVLGGLAEFERSLIRKHTTKGRARAVKAGKAAWPWPPSYRCIAGKVLCLVGEEKSRTETDQILRVSRSTIWRFLAKAQAV